MFLLVPILAGFHLSFTEWAGFGTPEVVGLVNYRRLFDDPQFYLSLLNTLLPAKPGAAARATAIISNGSGRRTLLDAGRDDG